ncbi:MAG: acyl-CoA/acyl-ACP dehydrogenase [Euryarchaeota archaeon]|nr:acyl-CoA/acyl-ACP dehydrogenase [Euryarchaeota archaeon]MDE1835654.1 acyl-CoA/acyl-ACP dehydrogenase [Euryarchaeota archaeon]MDE1879002.1 acyl-CoA/acyl-ACP dehydrogenase [Euryarchaeota archaeon]MDE2043724.1 acyl-CoA/acyl-ACP dehydrogenase [Thermoplasmata archaeon]
MPAVSDVLVRTQKVIDDDVRPRAGRNDKEGRFPREGVVALGKAGLLGLPLPLAVGGMGLGPREFSEVTARIAEADASLAMVYAMHVCGALVVAQAPENPRLHDLLGEMARGEHLTTLAFSEKGSRSHFWAPVSRAVPNGDGVHLTAQKSWVTSAGEANSYVVITQATQATSPTESTLYLMPEGARGLRVLSRWEGLGLRGNASSPMALENVLLPPELRLTPEGKAFDTLLGVVLPWFNLGTAAMSLGLCRASVAATVEHLRSSRLEHMGQSLAEAYPTLRARVAHMQLETDRLEALVEGTVRRLEKPDDRTTLAVLEVKAAGNEAALQVTAEAMRSCGGAAFSGHTSIDRFFRDAQAGAVMAPTVDQLQDFIGRALVGLPLFG